MKNFNQFHKLDYCVFHDNCSGYTCTLSALESTVQGEGHPQCRKKARGCLLISDCLFDEFVAKVLIVKRQICLYQFRKLSVYVLMSQHLMISFALDY